MKRVWTGELLAEVAHYRNLLSEAGIPCVIRNEQLSGAFGELPFHGCMPELWVLRDEDLPAAERLIARQREPVRAPAWRCARCGAPNEGQFAACWSCGAPDDGRP